MAAGNNWWRSHSYTPQTAAQLIPGWIFADAADRAVLSIACQYFTHLHCLNF